jgi:hypothetical protein
MFDISFLGDNATEFTVNDGSLLYDDKFYVG